MPCWRLPHLQDAVEEVAPQAQPPQRDAGRHQQALGRLQQGEALQAAGHRMRGPCAGHKGPCALQELETLNNMTKVFR